MNNLLVAFSEWEFACLVGLIEREIVNVERHRRVLGYSCGPEDRELLDAYLAQLRSCLETVSAKPAAVAA